MKTGYIFHDKIRAHKPEVFQKAAEDNSWTPFFRSIDKPLEWTFTVQVTGEPIVAHVTQRKSGHAKLHGPIYDHPSEYKVACKMVMSQLDKAEYALYGGRNCPSEEKQRAIIGAKKTGKFDPVKYNRNKE